jgi:hypothetical protein
MSEAHSWETILSELCEDSHHFCCSMFLTRRSIFLMQAHWGGLLASGHREHVAQSLGRPRGGQCQFA